MYARRPQAVGKRHLGPDGRTNERTQPIRPDVLKGARLSAANAVEAHSFSDRWTRRLGDSLVGGVKLREADTWLGR